MKITRATPSTTFETLLIGELFVLPSKPNCVFVKISFDNKENTVEIGELDIITTEDTTLIQRVTHITYSV
jgi:hypothetical protein